MPLIFVSFAVMRDVGKKLQREIAEIELFIKSDTRKYPSTEQQ